MARPRTATPTAPRPTPADPLADLRPQDDDNTPSPAPTADEVEVETLVVPVASEAFHEAARAEIVAAFHQDTVAVGALHKGGTCACRYLARLALRTALGAPVEPVQALEAQEDPEDGDDG